MAKANVKSRGRKSAHKCDERTPKLSAASRVQAEGTEKEERAAPFRLHPSPYCTRAPTANEVRCAKALLIELYAVGHVLPIPVLTLIQDSQLGCLSLFVGLGN